MGPALAAEAPLRHRTLQRLIAPLHCFASLLANMQYHRKPERVLSSVLEAGNGLVSSRRLCLIRLQCRRVLNLIPLTCMNA